MTTMRLSHAQAIIHSEAAVTGGLPAWKLRLAVETIEANSLTWEDQLAAEYIRENVLAIRGA